MTEKQFLQNLTRGLGGNIPAAEKNDILEDYREHFRLGREDGKGDDEIAILLGDPFALGRSIRAEYLTDQAEGKGGIGNVTRAVLASLSLGLFNLIFVVGPFAGLLGVLAGLWATVAGLALSGAASALAAVVEPLLRPFLPYIYQGEVWMHFAAFFIGTFLFSLGALGCLGMVQVTKWFFAGTIHYLRFNKRIIVKGE